MSSSIRTFVGGNQVQRSTSNVNRRVSILPTTTRDRHSSPTALPAMLKFQFALSAI